MDLQVGYAVSQIKTFSQANFDEFARLSGDDNPIHVDPDFSAQTKFGRTVAHGMLLYGTICGLLSQHFPGAAQVEQSLMFPAPTFTDETMTITAVITELMPKRKFRLKTTITNSRGESTCDGETILRMRSQIKFDKETHPQRLDRYPKSKVKNGQALSWNA
ncbi:MAG: MaoC family dehydratase [Chloroflexi bacterium]|nr:MaoC family dehydratase [Chloroflexota bacterium]